MDESDRELREKLRAAFERGGPDAGFEFLSKLGLSVEKEPEPGVDMRMRFGAGTDDAFSTTMYPPRRDRLTDAVRACRPRLLRPVVPRPRPVHRPERSRRPVRRRRVARAGRARD